MTIATRSLRPPRRRSLIAALACALLTLLPATGAAAASPDELPPGTEITDSAQGRAFLAETAARLAPAVATGELRGLDLAASRVYDGIPGDPDAIWIVPAGAELPEVTVSADGVHVSIDAVAEAPTSRGIGGAPGKAGLAAAGTLTWQSAYCYARYTEPVGWFDHCRQFGYIAADGDTSRDHWVFKQYGTCKSVSGMRMSLCSLSSVRKSGSTTQYWEDWAPTADTTGGCRSISISVSAFGVGVSGSYSGCETNDITKGAAAGTFTSAWKGSVASSERAVQSQIAVGVPQGSTPAFTLAWDINGYVDI